MLERNTSESTLLQSIAAQCKPALAKPVESVVPVQASSSDITTWALPGFGPGAVVSTSFGFVPIEALRRRDPVRTFEGSFLKVAFVDTIRLDRRFLLTHPEAQPIAIPKNGLGPDAPCNPTLVSGRLRIRSPGQFGKVSVRTAEDLVGLSHVARKNHGYFTYYAFHCGQPCTVNVNGMWVELDPVAFEAHEE